jgi:hypothetical protein
MCVARFVLYYDRGTNTRLLGTDGVFQVYDEVLYSPTRIAMSAAKSHSPPELFSSSFISPYSLMPASTIKSP